MLIWVLLTFDPRGFQPPLIEDVFDESYKCEFQRRLKIGLNPRGFSVCEITMLPKSSVLAIEARETDPERRNKLRGSRLGK